MEEGLITISQLNDFVFCPASIYFHKLYAGENTRLYQRTDQVAGTASHAKVDEGSYSTRRTILMGMNVYSEEYGLIGKIDIFDCDTGRLTERKRTIHKIYDGHIFQIYGQLVCLIEMGYDVKELFIYSMTDNKNYSISLPEDNLDMWCKFKKTINDIRVFEMDSFVQENEEKCKGCVYEPICDRSLL